MAFLFVLYAVFSFVVALAFAVFAYQDRLLYFPSVPDGARVVVPKPADVHLDGDEVFVPTPDGLRLHCYFINAVGMDSSTAPTVIYFHGNAGNIGHRLESASLLARTLGNVFLVEYRGYGKSEGEPSEKGIRIDAQAAFDYLKTRDGIDAGKIVVFGRSLGGAVAAQLACACGEQVMALILENTFSSVLDMIDVAMPMFRHVKFMCTNEWRTADIIGGVVCPILFLSGGSDELVPADQMQELYNRSRTQKKYMKSFPNGRHNETWLEPGYPEALMEFKQTVLG